MVIEVEMQVYSESTFGLVVTLRTLVFVLMITFPSFVCIDHHFSHHRVWQAEEFVMRKAQSMVAGADTAMAVCTSVCVCCDCVD